MRPNDYERSIGVNDLPEWAKFDHCWEKIHPVECDYPIIATSYRCSVCFLEADYLVDQVSGSRWVEYYDDATAHTWDISLNPNAHLQTCTSRIMIQALE